MFLKIKKFIDYYFLNQKDLLGLTFKEKRLLKKMLKVM